MATSAKTKEVKEFLDEVRKAGFKVVKGGKHWKILTAKGAVVKDDDGPLLVSTSPGDDRWYPYTRTRFERAGVLSKETNKQHNQKAKHDRPKNKRDSAEHRQASAERLRSPEMQAKKIAAVKEKARVRAVRTKKIRERLEPLVVALGGWRAAHSRAIGDTQSGVGAKEWGEVIFYFGRLHDRVENWPSPEIAGNNTRSLKNGGTLGDGYALMWELLLDELESYKTKEKIRNRFWELYKQARGLIEPEQTQPAPGGSELREELEAREEVVAAAPTPKWHPVTERNEDLRVPSVALRAVAQMAANLNGSTDHDDILKIGEEILRLELGVVS